MGAPAAAAAAQPNEDAPAPAQRNDVANYADAAAVQPNDVARHADDDDANDQAAQASQVSHAVSARLRYARAAELADDQQQHQQPLPLPLPLAEHHQYHPSSYHPTQEHRHRAGGVPARLEPGGGPIAWRRRREQARWPTGFEVAGFPKCARRQMPDGCPAALLGSLHYG